MTGFPINPPNTPLVDPQSGLITREWYRFFRDIQKTIGGEASPFDDSNFLAPPGITTATGGASDADALAPPLAPLAVDDPLLPPAISFEANDPLVPPARPDVALLSGADFAGPVSTISYFDFGEIAEPANPASTALRLWAESDGVFGQLHFKNSNGLNFQLGRDNISTVRNVSGATIPKGSWVYLTGANGTFPTIGLARADALATTPCFGLVFDDIANNSFGQVMTLGDKKSMDTSAFADGDVLYLSATVAGAVTTTPPTGTNIVQRVGVVVKGASVGAGIIAVLIGGGSNPTLTQTLTNKTLTLPKVNEAVDLTATSTELNVLDGATLSTAELNILDGATLTTTELNYVDGVTSAIQTQLDGKLGADPTLPYVLVEEFISGSNETGEMGTHNWTFTNGSVSMIAGVSNHPGVFRFTSSAVNGTVASFALTHAVSSGSINSLADVSEFWWIFREFAAGVTDVDMRVGMMSVVNAAPPANWIGLEKLAADTNWFFVTRASSVQTRTDTGVAAGTTAWLKLRFRKQAAADWRLSVNGGAEISHTTNIPTAVVQPASMSVVSGGVARATEFDFFSMVTPALSR